MPAGQVPADKYDKFLQTVNAIWDRVKERKGKERSAAGGQGHQRTPAMVHAIVQQALNAGSAGAEGSRCVVPRGGFTDVG